MIDMPPQCPPTMTIYDVLNIYAANGSVNGPKDYVCFVQTPDDLIGRAPSTYPYFDFESARKENESELPSVLPAEISATEFYQVILLGAVTFIAFAIGFATGFIYLD